MGHYSLPMYMLIESRKRHVMVCCILVDAFLGIVGLFVGWFGHGGKKVSEAPPKYLRHATLIAALLCGATRKSSPIYKRPRGMHATAPMAWTI